MDPTRARGLAVTHTAGTVGTSSAELVAANATRQVCVIQNLHDTAKIYVRLDGGTASATTGIQIGPGNLLNVRALGVITTVAINAISDTAATPVTIVEG